MLRSIIGSILCALTALMSFCVYPGSIDKEALQIPPLFDETKISPITDGLGSAHNRKKQTIAVATILSPLAFDEEKKSIKAELVSGLLSVYGLALENDAKYRGAIGANRAAQELQPQARSYLLPNMELSLGVAENDRDIRKGGLYRTMGQAGFTSEEMKVTVTQPIYHKDLWVQLGQAKNRIKKADFNLALARQELMVRVAERYFEVLRTTDGLTFAEAEKKAIDKQLQQVRKQFKAGLIGITDVEEAKARYDLAIAREIEAKTQIDNAHEALWQITGKYLPRLGPLGKRMQPVFPEPNDIDRWTQIALAQNIELAIARQSAEVARTEIKRVRAGHLPTLDLVGTHYREGNSADQYGERDTRTSSITLQFRLPIYQGGLVLSQSREAIHRHSHSQALEEMVEISRSVQQKTRDGFWKVRSGISHINALKQVLQSTEIALKAVKKGFYVGTRNSVDVLNSQRKMFRAKKDHADARYDYVLDVLRLKQVAGVLSKEDLVMVNGWLE
uniref:Outer membrane protein n=1 Tax=Candidatus Kentrum sp. FW TaxID=2126338 RepID=A0A450TME1_9GAMM|nr:MAG: outer membrane protein [Candidatus Kentron sp. FW]